MRIMNFLIKSGGEILFLKNFKVKLISKLRAFKRWSKRVETSI